MSALNAGVVAGPGPGVAGAVARRPIFSTRLMILILLFAYSGLSVYSGNFLPLRLVNGESMEPTLFSGDIVLLKGMSFSEIKTGDIIAYKVPDAAASASGPTTILHRVEDTAAQNGQRVLITKGDNSSTDPWPVTSAQVQGKQALRIPFVGKPVVMLTSPRGILFVSIAILISLLYIPAMVIFHTTVLKKPQPQKAAALTDGNTERLRRSAPEVQVIDAVVKPDEIFGPMPLPDYSAAFEMPGTPLISLNTMSPIVYAVEELTEEQRQIKASLTELSLSISEYAIHLKSHTTAVQSLARVSELLERNIQRQTELMEQGD